MSRTSSQSNSGETDATIKPGVPVPASVFAEKALPLHINLTHTPPKLTEDDGSVTPDDPGHIGTVTLVPCTQSTGDGYGWKGEKKVQVELLDVGDGEERIQVETILSIKATVIGNNASSIQGKEAVSEADGGAGGYESDNDDEPK
ncbi:hypothetical protein P691DRAFT_812983 [Macrolepiota fuliginosa MF-IS2]|uniref:Uncharacterized protein n=1 Tax=Macrolepiota fuliginosa MF-IS2 TaxID=1400762 RepID=A0A9P5XLJ9_9AGAR|nr:hypothetical protein P691DRAFT_812983 [Macrolepiota fuliginosa MF-IS2]